MSADHHSDEASQVSSSNDECRVLRELRECPDLFALISEWKGTELALQAQLRRQYPDDVVRAALTLVELRRKARDKFSRAGEMWFDRRGLEQSTSELVARHKASRFDQHVWDLCSGIGGDAIALAGRCEVTAVDLNPAARLRTEWNAQIYQVSDRIQTRCEDLFQLKELKGLVHIDPDRRAGSDGRALRLEDYVPGLPFLTELMTRTSGGAIKVGPASNFGGKFPGAEIELISLHGECKEATVWFGSLAGPQPFRATVLPSGESIAGHPLDAAVPVEPLAKYLYDPDPAIVRSGLVDVVAERMGLSRLDAAEEYLTGDTLVDSTFVHPFEVLAELPNNEHELRAWLRKSNFGQLEIKCRHIPIQAESLRRRLPLPGDQPGVLVFARLNGKSRAVLARRVSSARVAAQERVNK